MRFFVGVQRDRSRYKGTDVMLRALRRLEAERPDEVQVVKVENVPFEEYKKAMLSCDVLLDQLYSYTPAMNALQAMAQGLVVVSGGEPESYEILGCTDIHPIVNVLPNEADAYEQLRALVDHKARLPQHAESPYGSSFPLSENNKRAPSQTMRACCLRTSTGDDRIRGV